MATITVNFSTQAFFEQETNTYSGTVVFATPYNSSDISVQRGDTVRFVWTGHSGVTIERVALTGLDAAVWTTTGFVGLTSVGQVDQRVVKSDAPFGENVDLIGVNMRAGGVTFGQVNKNIDVFNPNDNVPNSFSFVPQTNAVMGQIYITSVKITGINVASNVSMSESNTGTFSFAINNPSSWRTTATTLQNNDILYVRCVTPSTPSTTRWVDMNVGGVVARWTVTTGSAESQVFISSGITALPVNFSQVTNFFGKIRTSPQLLDYVRGGQLVPNVTQNQTAGIATAAPLNLSSFRNSGTLLFFKTGPSGQGASWNSLSSGTTLSLNWTHLGFGNGRFEMGHFHFDNMVEFRYSWTFTKEDYVGTTPNPTFSGVTTLGSFSTANKSITIQWVVAQNREAFITGELTVEARLYGNTVSRKVPFSMAVWGP